MKLAKLFGVLLLAAALSLSVMGCDPFACHCDGSADYCDRPARCIEVITTDAVQGSCCC